MLIKISLNIFDKVVFKSQSGLWLQVRTFEEAKKINTLTVAANHLLTFSRRVSRFTVLRLFSKVISLIHNFIELRVHSKNTVNLKNIFGSVRAVLYDVGEECKEYNTEILNVLDGVQKYSMHHGININKKAEVERFSKKKIVSDVKAYLFSQDDKFYYQNKYGLMERNLKVVGVPRHDKKWMAKIIYESSVANELLWNDYIFLISRPLSPYLPYERKKKTLENIKSFAFKEVNKRVVIKVHPKERDDGLYKKVFGVENYGKNWVYSDNHPFALGKNSAFAISFYSSVVIDMLVIGVPVVECLDLRGIKEYDNSNSLRDESGDPVFDYRYFGLVLGVNDYEQLKMQTDKIMNNRDIVLLELTKRYQELFKSVDSPILQITNDILASVRKSN